MPSAFWPDSGRGVESERESEWVRVSQKLTFDNSVYAYSREKDGQTHLIKGTAWQKGIE